MPRRNPSKVYRLETAAKLIGIPRGVLRALKASGDFEASNLPRIMPGVHELDVQSFIEKLLSLAPTETSNGPMPQDDSVQPNSKQPLWPLQSDRFQGKGHSAIVVQGTAGERPR